MKKIRYPVKGHKVKNETDKAFVMLQAYMFSNEGTQLQLKDFIQRVQQNEMVDSGRRILSALIQVAQVIYHYSDYKDDNNDDNNDDK